MGAPPLDQQRTYAVTTLGCQMNVHDSERMSGLLEAAGYRKADAASIAAEDVDVLVINTCAVRENAATRLYGNLGRLVAAKRRRPGMQIAVGGCLAQQDRQRIVDQAPWVDVVFGTHNIDVLVPLLERARHNDAAQVEIAESLQVFPSTLPTRRESVYAGWVSISVGCNNTCTFCIVPHLRGRERDRRPGDVLAEVEALAAAGAIEVTLLGQNVNSYGVEFGDRGAFASLLRAVGAVDGIERVRFTSPHPAAFSDDVIEAMAETPTVMPQLHMPLQSGSDSVLRAMRRSYRATKFLGIVDRVRAAIPDAAITTDLIVGFPGETEDDFARTLDVVEQARFASAFTFLYSPRPGTPAATMDGQLPSDVVHERYLRLTELTDRIAGEENQRVVGRRVDVLLGESEGRKDAERHRLTGRAADNRLVHLQLAPGTTDTQQPRPGDMVSIEVTSAAPYHLIADETLGAAPAVVRRTRAGDAWLARAEGAAGHGSSGHGSSGSGAAGQGADGSACGTGSSAPAGPVVLGMPTLAVAR